MHLRKLTIDRIEYSNITPACSRLGLMQPVTFPASKFRLSACLRKPVRINPTPRESGVMTGTSSNVLGVEKQCLGLYFRPY